MGATLPNIEAFLSVGMDPTSGLPLKLAKSGSDGRWKPAIRAQLRVIDEQDAVNRFTWYNLPEGLNQKLIERILYYRGSAAFFYVPSYNKFFLLPYANSGNIDVYGRYTKITPVPFASTTAIDAKNKEKPWIPGMEKECYWDIVMPEALSDKILNDAAVILHDYTPQLSQVILPRVQLNDAVVDIMADCIPFMRTCLMNATGVKGMRVHDETEESNVKAANGSINAAALRGEKWIPIVGQIDFQEMTDGSAIRSEEFLLTLQGLDNYRLSTYGLSNGGLFQKKAHMLEAEEQMNTGNTGLILQDSLKCRQDFCDIVNSIWGLGIWVEPSEPVIGDVNGDGLIEDNEDNIEQEQEQIEEPLEGGEYIE